MKQADHYPRGDSEQMQASSVVATDADRCCGPHKHVVGPARLNTRSDAVKRAADLQRMELLGAEINRGLWRAPRSRAGSFCMHSAGQTRRVWR